MPKKFGTNTKKEEARERKKQKKKDEKERAEKEAEDEYWREKDPKILEKQAEKKRKEKEKEEKQKEKQRLKEELKKEEEEALAKKKKNQVSAPTRKQIQQYEEERVKKLLKEKEEEKEKNKDPIEDLNMDEEFVNDNYAKLNKKTDQGVDIIEATGIDSALKEISLEEYDKHPEKRMRQAWNNFFEKQLPIYKEQYPNLKRQQYINMIQKEFKTSPDNPVYMKKIKDAKQQQENDNENEEDEK